MEFTIDQIHPDVRALEVSTVRVVAHTMGPVLEGGQLSQNHWSIFLLVPNGSVRLNMTLRNPNSNDDTGRLEVTLRSYQLSSSATYHWDFGVAGGAKVSDFTDIIVQNKRQDYRMAEHGVGCRHWILTVMHDWQSQGKAGTLDGAGVTVDTVVQFNWSRGQQPIPLEIKKGTFF